MTTQTKAEEAMEKMRAAVLQTLPAKQLFLADVPRPAVERDDDVVMQVLACGICGTDQHIMAGQSYTPDLPFVLGHEPVGQVVETGKAADRWLGKRCIITLFTGCGDCAQCRNGDERLCSNVVSDTGVFNAWGGYADYLLVHQAQLLEVPPTLSDAQAASLVDAGATAANSVRVAMTRQLEQVLVLGAGPIGLISAEMLKAEGIKVQLVQRSLKRRAQAAAWGYEVCGTIGETDGPFDAVIDATGSAAVFADGIRALGPRGKYILAGYAVVPDVDFSEISHKEAEVIGIRSGSRADLAKVTQMAADGVIRLPEIATWPLEQINDALAALTAREVNGKAVIVPGGRAR